MLGLACLSVAENLGESGLNEWFTAYNKKPTFKKSAF